MRSAIAKAFALACGLSAVAAQACSSSSDDSTSAMDGGAADAMPGDGATAGDSGGARDDAGSSSDASPGGPCTFNRDCIATERCECDDTNGCFCEAGPRGTGRNGIDPCTTGDDCASSLCVEGPDGGSFCSDECTGPSGCMGALPVCEDVAGIGMICVRQP